MSLVAPLWLLAGTMALLVVLLHALRRNRVEVPSLILWRQLGATAHASSGLRPPRWSIPLLLQVLAVLILALALAQPLFGENTEATLHDIYVLDASAGMRGTDVAPSRFDVARAELIAALSGPTGRNRVSVAVAGGNPPLLFARQEEGTALAGTIRALTASDGTANWPELAQALAGLVRPGEDTRITIWTDSRSDPAAAIRGALPDVSLEVRTIGNPQSANAGITEAATAIGDTTGRWRVTGRVALKSITTPPEVVLRFQSSDGGSFLDWAGSCRSSRLVGRAPQSTRRSSCPPTARCCSRCLPISSRRTIASLSSPAPHPSRYVCSMSVKAIGRFSWRFWHAAISSSSGRRPCRPTPTPTT